MSKTQAPKDTEKTKDRILKAAIDEFIEYGFYGARTQRIANAAKVNKAMLHYYFGSKQAIYVAVLESVTELLVGYLGKISDEPVPIEKKIEQIMDVYIQLFTTHHSYTRLLLYEIARGGDELKKIAIKIFPRIPFNPLTGKIYKYFEAQMKAGKIRKVNFFQLLISIVAQVAPVYFARTIAGDIIEKMGFSKIIMDKFVAERKKFVINLIMEGIRK